MTRTLLILAALIWTVGSWYVYTCTIKGFCETPVEPVVPEVVVEEPELDLVPIINIEEPEPEPVVEKKCSQYLYGSMRFGHRNNYSETLKLEKFLREYEGASVPLDGYYGRDDESAVKRFQLKYRSEVLDPWGLNYATGYVYRTTRAKINQLYCAQSQ